MIPLSLPRISVARIAISVAVAAVAWMGWSRSMAADRDWPAYLGDPGATHYSSLRQITPKNVGQLRPAWTFNTGDADPQNRSQIQCNPLIVDGVLYGSSPKLKLFALDAATGRELWRFDPAQPRQGKPGGAIGVNRGLVFWREGRERRILFNAGYYIHALDPANGQPIASFGDDGRIDLREGLDRDVHSLDVLGNSPGALYRDLLIVSTRVGEGPAPSAPGHIRAYDVRTGKRRWIFHTIPHPGEFGYETWPPDAWKHLGGANCWPGLAVDAKRGIAFVPTGSAAFDFWGGNRIGANLFANCVLALDAATGRRKWHFQVVHHDLWDRDLPSAPVLLTVKRGLRRIPAVAQTTKDGHVWVFHRETGEVLFPWREEAVPLSDIPGEVAWTNQPKVLKPAPFARQVFTEDEVTDRTPEARAAVLKRLREARRHVPFSPPSVQGSITLPGLDGGAEWGGAAVDPDGILYVNGNEMAWLLNMVPTKPEGADAGSSGRALFLQLCAPCHGLNREGNAAQNIPPLTALAAKMKPSDVVTLLGTGRANMPSFEFLSVGERTQLAAYLLPETGAVRSETPADSSLETPARTRVPFTLAGYNRFLDPDGYPALKPPWGTLNAIDLNTGEFVWRVPLGEYPELTAKGVPPTGTENYGGPVVTAGGLVFIGATKDERFRAFDRRTGHQLWETRLPAGGYATPATYSVKGRQYVVIACGGGKMGTKSGDAYVAFALP